jgi:hypothetical protein
LEGDHLKGTAELVAAMVAAQDGTKKLVTQQNGRWTMKVSPGRKAKERAVAWRAW